MARFLAVVVVAVGVLAGVAEITSFIMAKGSYIAQGVTRIKKEVEQRFFSAKQEPALPTASDRQARCSKTSVLQHNAPECSEITDPEQRAACHRNRSHRVEICSQYQ